MKTIFKYRLEINGEIQEITMPRNSKIIFVSNQFNNLMFWAEVDPTEIPIMRKFRVHGTGQSIDKNGVYVGTVIVPPSVWHLYEVM